MIVRLRLSFYCGRPCRQKGYPAAMTQKNAPTIKDVAREAGVAVGNYFGTRYKRRAELAGGCILVLLGLKILMEHLGIF